MFRPKMALCLSCCELSGRNLCFGKFLVAEVVVAVAHGGSSSKWTCLYASGGECEDRSFVGLVR